MTGTESSPATSPRPLWEFSLRVYALPGCAEACIGLQDEQGLDVNILLLCLWSGLEGPGRLPAEVLDRCIVAVAGWQRDVVQPLRALRRELKREVPPGDRQQRDLVRARIAAAELAAESVEQDLLAAAVGPSARAAARAAANAGAATANLLAYIERAGVPASARVREQLEILTRIATGNPPVRPA